MSPAIDQRIYAKTVWLAPGGGEHAQWTAAGDPRQCRCGVRHTLHNAAVDQICPGVAHTWPRRPCVLCGLSWRVPGVVVPVDQPIDIGLGAAIETVELLGPPPPRCLYCEVLRSKPLELARHRVQAHKEDR